MLELITSYHTCSLTWVFNTKWASLPWSRDSAFAYLDFDRYLDEILLLLKQTVPPFIHSLGFLTDDISLFYFIFLSLFSGIAQPFRKDGLFSLWEAAALVKM